MINLKSMHFGNTGDFSPVVYKIKGDLVRKWGKCRGLMGGKQMQASIKTKLKFNRLKFNLKIK